MNNKNFTLSTLCFTVACMHTLNASQPTSPQLPPRHPSFPIVVFNTDAIPAAAVEVHSSSSGSGTPQPKSGNRTPSDPAQQPAHGATALAVSQAKISEKFAVEISESAKKNAENRKKIFSGSRTASTVAIKSIAKSPGLRVRSASIKAPALSPAFAASVTASGTANRQARRKRRPLSMADIPKGEAIAQSVPSNPDIAPERLVAQKAIVDLADKTNPSTTLHRRHPDIALPSDQRRSVGVQSLMTPAGITQTVSINAGQATVTIHNNAAPAGCCVIL